ncbi:5461_t:CDS:2 [Ambispora leptoticha]|uniref:5461_t:CDS:1 n=1 Tax=Ambispora leptoticha TaxID=144679 RepID=A0A9N9E8X1_9GLOM|nr:5461_t:CDS:2 [Ambispora leptoticha]
MKFIDVCVSLLKFCVLVLLAFPSNNVCTPFDKRAVDEIWLIADSGAQITYVFDYKYPSCKNTPEEYANHIIELPSGSLFENVWFGGSGSFHNGME